ncbi:MAG: TIGR01244 family sulfur transferase [Paracoccaceae bacterium]
MTFRMLTPGYATSPQIAPADVPAIREGGFTTVICNRPDGENPPELSAAALRGAVEAAGMTFVDNPVTGGALTEANVAAQGAAIAAAPGPVFAYCASGNRSSIVWALSQAGRQPTDALIAAAAAWGYNLEPYRERIEARTTGQG